MYYKKEHYNLKKIFENILKKDLLIKYNFLNYYQIPSLQHIRIFIGHKNIEKKIIKLILYNFYLIKNLLNQQATIEKMDYDYRNKKKILNLTLISTFKKDDKLKFYYYYIFFLLPLLKKKRLKYRYMLVRKDLILKTQNMKAFFMLSQLYLKKELNFIIQIKYNLYFSGIINFIEKSLLKNKNEI